MKKVLKDDEREWVMQVLFECLFENELGMNHVGVFERGFKDRQFRLRYIEMNVDPNVIEKAKQKAGVFMASFFENDWKLVQKSVKAWSKHWNMGDGGKEGAGSGAVGYVS